MNPAGWMIPAEGGKLIRKQPASKNKSVECQGYPLNATENCPSIRRTEVFSFVKLL
ncbi:hypothetical cytosolic protein [Syntrophus aciditrophicus SB]|uniref:Hypothetical cytosolic protein n=1 Tax=Syntrophus aciditrophicus (strain SB) TaxID=56780 RepID=Q2LPT2_SYNAS|nr:hypothetical cytosolic protein [Syntrophus aciditrophicus SB]